MRTNKRICHMGVSTLFRNLGESLANGISFEYPETVLYKQDLNVNPIIYKMSAIKYIQIIIWVLNKKITPEYITAVWRFSA